MEVLLLFITYLLAYLLSSIGLIIIGLTVLTAVVLSFALINTVGGK